MTNSGLKKDAYYFPHFSNARHDRKLRRVIKDLGIEGYGIFFMILEVLREQSNLCYPINDIDLLSEEFKTSEAKVVAVIRNFDLFSFSDDGMFFSPKQIEYLQPYFKKSELARLKGLKSGEVRRLKALRSLNTPEINSGSAYDEQEMNSGSADAEQVKYSKAKYSKAKYSKVNESKEKINTCVFSILSYFNFNEISNPDKLRLAADFCNTLNHRNRLDFFIAQFAGYQQYKAASGEKRHGFASFLGSYESHFEDGGWNARNWAQETPQSHPSAASYVSDIDEKMKQI